MAARPWWMRDVESERHAGGLRLTFRVAAPMLWWCVAIALWQALECEPSWAKPFVWLRLFAAFAWGRLRDALHRCS